MSLGYTHVVRLAMVPDFILEDRRSKGLDRRDEVWAGVLHMVPPAAFAHNRLLRDLLIALLQIAKRRGLDVFSELGMFDPKAGENNFRVPDLVVAAPDRFSARGIDGAATLVVEVLSPRDESRAKLSFYAEMGVREVWLIHPVTRSTEVFELDDGELVPVKSVGAVVRSPELGIDLEVVDGKLRLRDGEHVDDV